MPKAMTTISGIRPSGLTGASAPRPLTQWIEHLRRTRLAAKEERGIRRKRRAATQKRLAEAERLVGRIIAGADVVAQGAAPDADGDYPAVYLLLTLHTASFNDLAIFGSELEDLEDSTDAELTEADRGEEDHSDYEPSSGGGPVYPPSMVDLEEASHGFGAKDQAIIKAARARYKQPSEPEQHGVLTYATVDPEIERVGVWALQRRKGGAK